MRAVLSMIRKEFLQIRRDRQQLLIVLLSPMIQLLLLGFAANLDVRHLPLAVCDLDRSAESRRFLDILVNSEYFKISRRLDDIREVDRAVDGGSASMVVVVPRGFANDVQARRPASVQFIVDGTESLSATIGVNAAGAVASRYSSLLRIEMLEKAKYLGIRPQTIDARVRVWYNPDLKSRNFFVPGVLALVLMMMTMLLTAKALVREKENGTMEQLIVTPIRPLQLMLGKLIPCVLIGLTDSVLVIAVARLLLRVPLKGSVPFLFLMILDFILTTLGLGLFISTISQNQQQAMLTSVFFIMPMMLFGGFVFPIENMPRIFQLITYAVPIRYFFVIVRGVFLKGVGWSALWREGLALLIIGSLTFGLSLLRFHKKLD